MTKLVITSNLAATTSVKTGQPSSSPKTLGAFHSSSIDSGQVKSPISSSFGQSTTTFLQPSQPSTIVDQTNHFSTAGTSPKPSFQLSPSVTLKDSGVYSSNKPTMVQPSQQLNTLQHFSSTDSSQILTATTTPMVTKATIPATTTPMVTKATTPATTTPMVTKATIPPKKSSLIVKTASLSSVLVSKTVTTSTKSEVLVSAHSPSTHISASPTVKTHNYKISSIPKVMSSLTSLPNSGLIPTASKLNLTSSSSNVMLSPSLSSVFPAVSSNPVISSITSISAGWSSSNVILNPTSSKVKLSQTSSTTVVPSLSSSDVKLNLSSYSTDILHSSSSAQLRPDITSLPVITESHISASKVLLTVTASPFKLNSTLSNVVESTMTSVPLTSQGVRSTVLPTSTITHSSSSTIKPSCYSYNNSLTCIKLQPSATMPFNSTASGAALSSSQNASSSFSTVSGVNTSVVFPTNTPGTKFIY